MLTLHWCTLPHSYRGRVITSILITAISRLHGRALGSPRASRGKELEPGGSITLQQNVVRKKKSPFSIHKNFISGWKLIYFINRRNTFNRDLAISMVCKNFDYERVQDY